MKPNARPLHTDPPPFIRTKRMGTPKFPTTNDILYSIDFCFILAAHHGAAPSPAYRVCNIQVNQIALSQLELDQTSPSPGEPMPRWQIYTNNQSQRTSTCDPSKPMPSRFARQIGGRKMEHLNGTNGMKKPSLQSRKGCFLVMGAGGFEPPNANARGFTIRVYTVFCPI